MPRRLITHERGPPGVFAISRQIAPDMDTSFDAKPIIRRILRKLLMLKCGLMLHVSQKILFTFSKIISLLILNVVILKLQA